MGVPLFLCVVSMAMMTYSLVAVTTGAVNLSADAEPIPGGYAVPERGNVTFTCSSSSGGILVWRVNLTTFNNIQVPITTSGLNELPGFSSQDTASANPASFTFHNISLENSPSIVECIDSHEVISRAVILVEGSPNCPTVHTTVATTSLTVTIQKVLMMWLPEWYCVEATSYNGSIMYNSSLKAAASFNMTSLQPGTVYNISVIPCNMAGCNKSCDIHSVQTESDTVPGSGVILHGDSLPLFLIIVIVVAILVTLALLAIIGSISVVCLIRRWGNKQKSGGGEIHYEDIVAVDPPYDDLVAISTSFQDPNSSNVDAVHVRQASFQLHSHDATSTPAALNEESVGGVTSIDVAMEDNPAYQPLSVAGTASATMDSAQSDCIIQSLLN